METASQETEKRKAKNGTGTGIIKTGILEYNMMGIMTNEKRYGNSEKKE